VKKILITGGAGYIGSHVTRQLSETGRMPVVYDNLSTGFREALLHGETLIQAELSDADRLDSVFDRYPIDTVMHFAASIVAPESVTAPVRYYENNTGSTIGLLKVCSRRVIKNFIFSGTASVYGIPAGGAASEDAPTNPINPYGASKLMSERIIADAAKAHGFRFVVLRYFNVAGADPQARMGQRSKNATHLLKVCCQAALGMRESVSIYGDDYDTPDGTGVRDYIHVEDIAQAHLDALVYLESGGESLVVNAGYGRGYSVREVIKAVQEVTGRTFTTVVAPRRPGDPPVLIAKADRIRKNLNWSPRYNDLARIVEDAWRWEKKLYGSANGQDYSR